MKPKAQKAKWHKDRERDTIREMIMDEIRLEEKNDKRTKAKGANQVVG